MPSLKEASDAALLNKIESGEAVLCMHCDGKGHTSMDC